MSNTIDDEYLESLGFSGIEFMDPNKRDGIRRKVWIQYLEPGNILSIRLIYKNNEWEVELIEPVGEKAKTIVENNFEEKSLNEVITFIKKYIGI